MEPGPRNEISFIVDRTNQLGTRDGLWWKDTVRLKLDGQARWSRKMSTGAMSTYQIVSKEIITKETSKNPLSSLPARRLSKNKAEVTTRSTGIRMLYIMLPMLQYFFSMVVTANANPG